MCRHSCVAMLLGTDHNAMPVVRSCNSILIRAMTPVEQKPHVGRAKLLRGLSPDFFYVVYLSAPVLAIPIGQWVCRAALAVHQTGTANVCSVFLNLVSLLNRSRLSALLWALSGLSNTACLVCWSMCSQSSGCYCVHCVWCWNSASLACWSMCMRPTSAVVGTLSSF